MLQRYEICMDDGANRFSIKEFAVLDRAPRNREFSDPTQVNYSLIHEETYDRESIRSAMVVGRNALISELRSENFYPVQDCVERIANIVIKLFHDPSDTFSEMFYDDRSPFSGQDGDLRPATG